MKFTVETLSYDLLQEHVHAALKGESSGDPASDAWIAPPRVTVSFPLKAIPDQPESRIKERAIEELQRVLWAAADSLTPESSDT